MKELIGLAILTAIVIGLTALAIYYFLRKIAEKQFLSGPLDVINWLLSGDRRIRSAKGINRACRALMRRAYVAAPNGRVAMSQAFIRIHPEDLEIIRTIYGQEFYRRELASYHQKVAQRRGWKFPHGKSVLDVRFTGDANRPVATPALDAASGAVPRGAGTRVFGASQANPTATTTTVTGNPSGNTEPAGRFTGPQRYCARYPLSSSRSIGFLGRFCASREHTAGLQGMRATCSLRS
ncbi:hypothetical protein [Pseudarthrobacter sp. NCCP-2145]|uniref:hypothetical protein n=1 Tax=Pseudarthrobacter sp. NCCP-2145 TaxID=2942290 RepID=UPI00203C18CF|nr:hypothetical protein [Pseudarthrobacter sp. NCCP-2145]GKV74453.1 hypothetical protein NCCP2145_38340 [Pseudarthrobacter sp. NCCP-2145]